MEGAALLKRALFLFFRGKCGECRGKVSDLLNAVGLRFAVGRFLVLGSGIIDSRVPRPA